MFLFMIAFGFGILNYLAVAQFLWLLFARQSNQLIALFGNYPRFADATAVAALRITSSTALGWETIET